MHTTDSKYILMVIIQVIQKGRKLKTVVHFHQNSYFLRKWIFLDMGNQMHSCLTEVDLLNICVFCNPCGRASWFLLQMIFNHCCSLSLYCKLVIIYWAAENILGTIYKFVQGALLRTWSEMLRLGSICAFPLDKASFNSFHPIYSACECLLTIYLF